MALLKKIADLEQIIADKYFFPANIDLVFFI